MNNLIKKHNLITFLFYCYVLVSFICFALMNFRIDTLYERLNYYDDQIDTIKNEAVLDYQSLIQLQSMNK